MSKKSVYVLHKHGAPSHYTALQLLLKEHKIELKHREFSIFTKIYKSIITLDGETLLKQFTNIGFFLSLFFSRNKQIVLGIAPFDKKLGKLLFYLKDHKVYYHTSWTVWDKSFHPNTRGNSLKIFEEWRYFLEEKALHIFSVTNKSKQQLLENYNISEQQISVVNHALSKIFLQADEQDLQRKEPNTFIYYGRIIAEKGIKELLAYFSNKPNAKLTLIGEGKEVSGAKEFAAKHSNISFQDYTKDKSELISILKKQQYLILNSKKSHKWEELFGLVIIEAMSQAVIPISSNHSGPKEIISEDIGYLFEEGSMSKILDTLIEKNAIDTEKSLTALRKSQYYSDMNVAQFWKPILD